MMKDCSRDTGKFRSFVVGCLGLFLFSSCSQTMVSDPALLGFGGDPVLPKPGGDPNIFRLYSRVGDSKIAAGWPSRMDMSGVSFDQRQSATLISRRHVVMAAHYQRKIGAKVIFHDRRGKFLERTLIQRARVLGDVAVGLLDRPVPPGYRTYPLPSPTTDPASLIGLPVIVTDQNHRLFFHKVHRVSTVGISFIHDVEDKHGWGKNLVSGDSGNPSFLIAGGELVLLETHTSGGAGAGPYYGSATMQEKLREVMTEMDPAFPFRTVPVN